MSLWGGGWCWSRAAGNAWPAQGGQPPAAFARTSPPSQRPWPPVMGLIRCFDCACSAIDYSRYMLQQALFSPWEHSLNSVMNCDVYWWYDFPNKYENEEFGATILPNCRPLLPFSCSWLLYTSFFSQTPGRKWHKPTDPTKGGTWRFGAQWSKALINFLARVGVWQTGTLRAVTADNLSPSVQVPPLIPHWLSNTEVTALPRHRLCPCKQKLV